MTISHFGFDNPRPGMVVMWDKPISEIPTGWAICDGNNGTMDMLERFPQGAIDDSSVGKEGGSKTLTLSTSQLPSHSHPGERTDGTGNHYHKFDAHDDFDTGDSGNSGEEGSAYNTTSNGLHSHNLNSVGSAGSGASIDNVPQYYEVVFIQKL